MTHASLLVLLACIEPQAPTATAPDAAGTVPPEAAPPAAPVGDAAAGAPGGAPPPKDGATSMGAPPKNLADLVGAKPSVDLTLTLDGAPSAVVDFVVEGTDGPPQIIAQERMSSATATFKVPATYGSPIWITAFYDADQNGPDAKDPAAVSATAIKLDGTPVKVALKMAPGNFPPKIGPEALRPVPAGTAPPANVPLSPTGEPGTAPPAGTPGAPPPGAGTAPGGAPPAGAPPAGAPGAAPAGPVKGAAPVPGKAPSGK
ncbi:MAG: hypothetical protein RLZZ299_2801 [Pseudomonadota bacterium]|jgi:hypothetical protein